MRHLDFVRNKGDLVIAVQGDKLLFNQYGVILVNPAKHPHVTNFTDAEFRSGSIAELNGESPAVLS